MALPGVFEREATVAELYAHEGKAELIDGRLVALMPTGRAPSYAALEIALSLRLFVRQTQQPGIAVGDNAGFLVSLPRRKSFSPDAGYYEGPNSGMGFFEGAPVFAVEVRSENDYGVVSEREQEQKRADYFLAGTLVVWDVDLLSDGPVVRKYTALSGASAPAATFSRGDRADAAPVLLGWALSVDDLFEP